MLAILLVFMMVFTLIPGTALASGENSNLTSAYWPNFRGNDCNMAVVDAQTPIDINKTSKLWSVKLSTGWDDMPSSPIIVGDYIYTTAGTNIIKIDRITGNIVKTGVMAGSQGYATATPPVYADGKIITVLTGKVQAFDAETLNSLWVYTDDLGGQCQSPLTYSAGCVYTGFYNRGNANFVCIDISNDNVTEGVKTCKWKYTGSCDFYWAGSAIVGNAVIVGTQANTLLSLNKNTGEVISKVEGISGAISSSIAYENEYSNIYFTAKGGYIYKAKVDSETGEISNVSGKKPAGADNNTAISDSVSTPVVYKGKIYFVGSNGWGQPGKLCIVNSDDLSLISAVQIGNNPQCSILLSTAYEESGYLYLYTTYNDNPGGIKMIKVPESIDSENQPEVTELFTPSSEEQNYCICSVICDENGTIYYKNDSGYLFAINLNENAVAEKKEEAIRVLDSYTQDNYYETQWTQITTIINDAKTAINAATTINEINLALDTAKDQIDLIETKQQFKESITIYTTIADKGQIVIGNDDAKTMLADTAVTIADTNKDGKHTADEAFTQLHEQYCKTGEGEDGYGYATSQYDWGTGISKFWNESTTAVGYYINDICANGLGDILKDGDYLTAFIYKDQTGWSDAYSLFDKNVYAAELNKKITLTLTELKYGVQEEPCIGASIKVIGSNNSVRPYITDEKGEVKLKFENAGTYKVMAYKDDGSIVPAVATVTVTGTVAPPTEQNAKVTFTLKGDTVHSGSLHSGTYYPTWIHSTTVELSDSIKTVGDVFKKVLGENGYKYVGLGAGYISSITTPSGLTLSEFDNGKDSGWMYTVNGSHPNVSLNNYVLSDGDVIVWHYTDNYKAETDYAGPKEDQSSVTTSGTSGSATTTTPTEVTVSGDTAKATIKTENTSETIKQAKEKKSAEIVIEVASGDIKTAEKVQVELPTATAKEILNTTTADLTVKTPIGTVTVPQDALKEAVAEAKGTTITIEVAAVSKPTDTQKKAAGTNGQIISVTIKSGSTVISTFGGKSLKLKSEVPAKLKGKNIAAIHIAADGTIEQLAGKLIKEGTKEFYEFITAHLSTFALVDADEIGLEAKDEEANIEKVKKLVSDMSLKASSSRTSKKNIKVALTVDKDTAAAIKEIEDMGYTVKYKYYRSTRKASKYQAKITKTTKSFTNTSGKKGTKYYYKARFQVYDKDGKLVAQTALKQCRYAARMWSK